jgi:alkylation response protein AidB-like acyl-CoA dehydrogenase
VAALTLAQDVANAALCAEGVGVMEQTLKLTTEYMNQRKQFGVVISSFQALRHRVADMKMQLELARSMSYYGTLKLVAPAEERHVAIARAKVQLGQSMRYVGQQAVQLHGGIGVTDEYVGSHYFKRLTQMEMTGGDTLHIWARYRPICRTAPASLPESLHQHSSRSRQLHSNQNQKSTARFGVLFCFLHALWSLPLFL